MAAAAEQPFGPGPFARMAASLLVEVSTYVFLALPRPANKGPTARPLGRALTGPWHQLSSHDADVFWICSKNLRDAGSPSAPRTENTEGCHAVLRHRFSDHRVDSGILRLLRRRGHRRLDRQDPVHHFHHPVHRFAAVRAA